MKYLLVIISLFLFVKISAQESNVFIRTYNNQGKKIARGKVLKITDSTLILKKRGKSLIISSKDISYLKIKRSHGHAALIGAIPGIALMLISSVGKNDTGKGFAIIGTFAITTIGAAFGYLKSKLFKKSEKYLFEGDSIKWNSFKEDMYQPRIRDF